MILLWPSIYPFVLGIIISFILQPVQKILMKYLRLPLKTSIILVLILFICFILLFFIFLAPMIINESYNLLVNMKNYLKESEKILNTIIQKISEIGFSINKKEVIENFSEFLNNFFAPFFNTTVSYIFTGLQNIIINLIIIPLTIFYVLKDKDNIIRYLSKFMSNDRKKTINVIYKHIVLKLRAYINSLLITCMIISVFMTLILHLFGVKHPFILGLFSGIISIIPYIGLIIQTGLIILVQLSGGATFGSVAWLFIFQLLFYAVISFIIQPKLTNISIKIHPLLFIMTIMIGGHIYGIVGMLFSIPVYIIFQTIIEFFMKRNEHELF
jgi:predicted PurR-regulated permease PerM